MKRRSIALLLVVMLLFVANAPILQTALAMDIAPEIINAAVQSDNLVEAPSLAEMPTPVETAVTAETPEATKSPSPAPAASEPPLSEPNDAATAMAEPVMPTEAPAAAEASAPVDMTVSSESLYGYANLRPVEVKLRLGGGAAPYTVNVKWYEDDAQTNEEVHDISAEGEYAWSYMPARAGTCTALLLVTDALGQTAQGSVSLPVAAPDDENGQEYLHYADAVKLTGDWAVDLAAIAASQIGYRESSLDFIINEGEDTRAGATIYGAWNGERYGKWSALFVAWSLAKAGIPEQWLPREADCAKLLKAVKDVDVYEDPESAYAANPGDLVFISLTGRGQPDHIAIVSGGDSEQIEVIEGGVEGQVRQARYSRADRCITGYASLEKVMIHAGLLPVPTAAPSEVPATTPTPVPSATPETTSAPTTSEASETTSAPTPSEASETTSTPNPSATSEATSAPTPSTTPEMTPTVIPSETPVVTSTPVPSATPEPTPTPAPTATPEPTPTPTPSVAPTVAPSESPDPALTPEPTGTPEAEFECGLPQHAHNEACYDAAANLVCGLEEHIHTSACMPQYDPEHPWLCGKDEHTHVADCYAEDGALICALEEHVHGETCAVLCGMHEHLHDEDECYDAEGNLACELEEHIHIDACYGLSGDDALPEADSRVVVEAIVYLIGEYPSVPKRMTVNLLSESGSIAEHLTDAGILVNGQPYDGKSALNPGEQFTLALKWQLVSEDLKQTLTYTYAMPPQIHVDDVAETILYDASSTKQGVYSISNGILTVTYDSVANFNETNFKLNASWNQEAIGQETTIEWNDKLKTPVKFDNSQIATTKELLKHVNQPDGSLVAECAVNVSAKGAVNDITLTDTLTAEHFHFCQGYYADAEGVKHDYRYKLINADGTEGSYSYANFPEGTFDENGTPLTDTVEFPQFPLAAGQQYVVEYGVKLDADARFELDKYKTATGLTNSATASYAQGGETISSSVTVTDTYQADEAWVIKEKGNLSEGDVQSNTDVPWKVCVNPVRAYDMGGAVIGDLIKTEGVVYNQTEPITVTVITGDKENPTRSTNDLKWVTLADNVVQNIHWRDNAIDDLFTSDYSWLLNAINAAVEPAITENNKDELSQYAFVAESNNQFVYFAPSAGEPATYELSYTTDISKAQSNTLVNNASAVWKSWSAGMTPGYFIQAVKIEKKNHGVREQNGEYFVDWDIDVNVPANCNAIPDVLLRDNLPHHEESDGYDQLVGLASELDYAQATGADKLTYLNALSSPAFTITTDSSDSAVQAVAKNATCSIGHPLEGIRDGDYALYEPDDTLQGQFAIVNGAGQFANKRLTPVRFGINLGDLPDTLDKDGYTITIKYTTKVDPKLIANLNGKASGYNGVSLLQRQETWDMFLGYADASYWVTHSTVTHPLSKSVEEFDAEKSVITYKVVINPDASMVAGHNFAYTLRDSLNIPGATYVEDSFKLALQADIKHEFNPDKPTERITTIAAVNFDREVPVWHYGWDGNKWWDYCHNGGNEFGGTDPEDIRYMAGYIGLWPDHALESFHINKGENQNSSFELSVTNLWGKLASTEGEYKGKLVPMVLTYQVQLPQDSTAVDSKIVNSANLTETPPEGTSQLLGGVSSEFNFASALHKRLYEPPTAENGYTASFRIDVNKSAQNWPANATFTVDDSMSKTLAVDITSVEVYGIKPGGASELLNGGCVVSYNDMDYPTQNVLSVTITDSDAFIGYRILYACHVQGERGAPVDYDNVASLRGTAIQSERVENTVEIQEQSGSVTTKNIKLRLLKYDASDIDHRLQVTFALYAYDPATSQWVQKHNDLTTGENGELVLDKENCSDLALNTWYKLEEVRAPQGYMKSVTYFYTPALLDGEDPVQKPEEIKAFTEVSMDESTIHQVPNYRINLRLRKVDAADDHPLSGAVFALYSDSACSGAPLATITTGADGIAAFDLSAIESDSNTVYLKETQAPAGYNLSANVYTVSWDEEGNVSLADSAETVIEKVENAYPIPNNSGYELPATGGTGTQPYAIGGLAMLLLAAVPMLRRHSRRSLGA